MQVNFRDSGHANYQAAGIVVDSDAHFATGSAEIVGDVLLFGFTKIRGRQVVCSVEVDDDQTNLHLSWEEFPLAGEDDTRFVEFSEFPSRANGQEMATCNYRVTVTVPPDIYYQPGERGEVLMNIYRG